MGAGDDSEEYQQRRIEDLLQQAMALDLGFPEAEVLHAIKHLVQVYGSVEEAYAWIPRDNFTVLVEHVLDNREMTIQQSVSMACGDLSSNDLRKVSPIRESGNKPSKRHLIKKKMLNKCDIPGIAKQICHDSSNITPCSTSTYYSNDVNPPDHCISRNVPSYQKTTQQLFEQKISTSLKVLEGPGHSSSRLPQKMDLESRKDKAKIQSNASEVKSQKPDPDSAIVVLDENESTQSLCLANGKWKSMQQRVYKGTVNKRVKKGIGSCHYFNAQTDPSSGQRSVRGTGQEATNFIEKGKLSCLEVMPQDKPEARMLLSNGCKDLASSPHAFSQQHMHSNNNGCHKIPHMPENKLKPLYGIANGSGTLKKASSSTLLEVNDVHEDRSFIELEPPTAANGETDSTHKQRTGSEALKRIKSKVEVHAFMTSDDRYHGNKDAINADIMICGKDVCTQPVEANTGSKSICKTGEELSSGNRDIVVANNLGQMHGMLDCVEDSLLEKLESSLEEGDCERAIELFAAWKRTLNVETIDTTGNRLLWEG